MLAKTKWKNMEYACSPSLLIEGDILPSRLRHAIEQHELCVHYQPRYDIQTKRVVALEALVRWQHPTLGLLPPDKFISLAENNNLISQLSHKVFEQCCIDLAKLRHRLKQPVTISVNVSLLQCDDSLYVPTLFDVSKKYGLLLNDFEFELTESFNPEDKSNVLRFCQTLQQIGAEISLDDFGTSQSPLNNLCDLATNTIKIDRCFTEKIGLRAQDEILIQHLILLAHEMNIKVVVEGIENAYQRDQLINMDCDQLQGFYLCPPLHINHITQAYAQMQASTEGI